MHVRIVCPYLTGCAIIQNPTRHNGAKASAEFSIDC